MSIPYTPVPRSHKALSAADLENGHGFSSARAPAPHSSVRGPDSRSRARANGSAASHLGSSVPEQLAARLMAERRRTPARAPPEPRDGDEDSDSDSEWATRTRRRGKSRSWRESYLDSALRRTPSPTASPDPHAPRHHGPGDDDAWSAGYRAGRAHEAAAPRATPARHEAADGRYSEEELTGSALRDTPPWERAPPWEETERQTHAWRDDGSPARPRGWAGADAGGGQRLGGLLDYGDAAPGGAGRWGGSEREGSVPAWLALGEGERAAVLTGMTRAARGVLLAHAPAEAVGAAVARALAQDAPAGQRLLCSLERGELARVLPALTPAALAGALGSLPDADRRQLLAAAPPRLLAPALQRLSQAELSLALAALDPDARPVVFSALPPPDRALVLGQLRAAQRPPLLAALPPPDRAAALLALPGRECAATLRELAAQPDGPASARDALREMPPARRGEVLACVPPDDLAALLAGLPFDAQVPPRPDEACPVSTGGGTRRVRLVREGGGGGGVPPRPAPPRS